MQRKAVEKRPKQDVHRPDVANASPLPSSSGTSALSMQPPNFLTPLFLIMFSFLPSFFRPFAPSSPFLLSEDGVKPQNCETVCCSFHRSLLIDFPPKEGRKEGWVDVWSPAAAGPSLSTSILNVAARDLSAFTSHQASQFQLDRRAAPAR